MKTNVLFLPMHLPKSRRKARSPQQILFDELARLRQKSLSQLGECLNRFVPARYLQPSSSGALSRRRVYSKENTFWAFFSQVLDSDGGCKEVIRKIQAFAALKSNNIPSSSTAAYCKARQKLDQTCLESILKHTTADIQSATNPDCMHGRRVIVVDGTGISMPDTEENQEIWPQQKNQKPGCGFPQAAICACFNLHTGTLLSHEIGNKKSHELPMLRKQWDAFQPGDIFLGDKGFCSYYDQSNMKDRGVDSVITLARRKPVTRAQAVKVLGKDDLLIHWIKPAWNKRSSYSRDEWERLPKTLLLRQIKVTVKQAGFRVTSFHIITTLLDAEEYPASEIADLYYQRWDVELFFRDIKTTMGMDILRCKTPEMVRKEILMHLIAYNCIRRLMLEAAEKKNVTLRRISFKGSVQALRQWEPHLNQRKMSHHDRTRLMRLLID
ncbi:MAG: IS4 family transposase, partial [Mariprofundus sp.]